MPASEQTDTHSTEETTMSRKPNVELEDLFTAAYAPVLDLDVYTNVQLERTRLDAYEAEYHLDKRAGWKHRERVAIYYACGDILSVPHITVSAIAEHCKNYEAADHGVETARWVELLAQLKSDPDVAYSVRTLCQHWRTQSLAVRRDVHFDPSSNPMRKTLHALKPQRAPKPTPALAESPGTAEMPKQPGEVKAEGPAYSVGALSSEEHEMLKLILAKLA